MTLFDCSLSIALLFETLLVALAAIAGQQDSDLPYADERSLPGEYYSVAYQAVNDYLMDNLKDPDPEKNMDLLNRWLISGQAGVREAIALHKLTAMNNIRSKCDQSSYETFMDNYGATAGRASYSGLENARRIDLLINYYCSKHANECRSSIEINFKVKYRTVDRLMLRQIATLTNSLIEKQFSQIDLDNNPDYISRLLFDEIILDDPANEKTRMNTGVIYSALKSLVANSPDSKYLLHHSEELTGEQEFSGSKVTDLMNRWLVIPCERFVQLLGPGVFIEADFDSKFSHEVDPNQSEFYRAWARFKLCKNLINSKQTLNEDLVEFARKMYQGEQES